jgi:hypothetical protein
MFKFMKRLRALVPRLWSSAATDAAYLDEARDIAELERRMRAVEARR